MVMNDALGSVWLVSKDYFRIYLEELKETPPNCSEDRVEHKAYVPATH
jgi:hypothetical protein